MLERGRRRSAVVAPGLGALALFALLSSALFWRLLLHLDSSTTGTNDSYVFVWWLAWVPHAVLHGHDPLVSGALFAPFGINAMWNTSVLVLGVLLAPLTVLTGPVVAGNVAVVLAPAVSAAACFGVARRWVRVGPALLAGLVYGFSPFVLGQSRGHLHLTVAWFPPVVVAVLAEAVGPARLRPARLGALLGLAVAVQLLLSEEVLASTFLVAAASAVVLAVPFRRSLLDRRRYLAVFGAAAVGTALLLCAVPLAVQFAGPQVVHGSVQPVALGADLAQLVVPSPLQLVRLSAPGVGFVNLSEQTGYLGLPLLLLLVLAHVRLAGGPLRLLEVPAVVAGVLSLGTRLVVAGRSTGLPLPGAVLARAPVLGNLVPVRFSEHVVLCAALLLAGLVDRPVHAAAGRAVLAVAVLAAVVALLPAGPLDAFRASTPVFFTRPRDVALLPEQELVVVTPYPYAQDAGPMLWQARAADRFRMAGGYGVVPGPGGVAAFGLAPGPLPELIQAFAGGHAPSLARQRAAVREVQHDDVDAVVLAPMVYDARAAAFVARMLHWPVRHVDGVWLVGPEPPPVPPGATR